MPPLLLAIALYVYGGMQWLAWGFLLPTTTLAHATFAINTINHLYGSRRFDTIDESRNNVITAVFAAGEGWHNNHHRYQRSARNGFYWWEFDPTWYVIKAMSLVGLAWDLQPVPERIYREARERTQEQESGIRNQVRTAGHRTPGIFLRPRCCRLFMAAPPSPGRRAPR